MKLGVAISWRGATIESSRAIAREADRRGFEYLWLTEAWGLEALSSAGYLLGLTSKIKVGVGVLNVFSRSAALIGMACATLDQIAPGRFLLGLGSSAKAVVEGWHGLSYTKPAQRTKEYVEIVKRVARGDQLDYSGEIFKLSGFRLYTKARQSEQEVYIGAIGEKNLEMAGAIAQGAIVTMYPLSKIPHALEILGRSAPSITGKKTLFAYFPIKITRNSSEAEKARMEVAKYLGFYIASMGKYYAANLSSLGFDKNVKRIVEAHAAGGSRAAAEAVGDELAGELSIVGTIDEIRNKVSRIPKCVVPVFALDSTPLSRFGLDELEPLLAVSRSETD